MRRQWIGDAAMRILEIPPHWREKREEISIELFSAYERGIAEERERCAKIAESHLTNLDVIHDTYERSGVEHTAEKIAAAIRSQP